MIVAPNVHLVCEPGDSCPDCFQLDASASERYAAERRTVFRDPGEDDHMFWQRVLGEAREMQEVGGLDRWGFPDRTVLIFLMRDMRPSDADAGDPDARYNLIRKLVHVGERDPSSMVRIEAWWRLAQVLGMVPCEGH